MNAKSWEPVKLNDTGLSDVTVRIGLFITAALLFTGCGPTPTADYEFHSSANPAILWRCNRRTGEVDVTFGTLGYWKRVTNRTDLASARQAP